MEVMNADQPFLFQILQHEPGELSVEMKDAAKPVEDEGKRNNSPSATRFLDLRQHEIV